MKIPVHVPQIGVPTEGPATLVDSQSFALEALAQARLWQETSKNADELTKLGKALQLNQDMNDLSDAKRIVDKQLIEYGATARKNKDPDQWLPTFRKDVDTIIPPAMEGLKPHVAAALKKHIVGVLPSYESKIVSDTRKYKYSALRGNIPQAMDDAVNTILNAPDDLVAANAEANFKGLLYGASSPDMGYLQPSEAALWAAKFDQALKLGKVNKAMLADAPGTLKLLESEKGAFGLDETERGHVIPHVSAQVRRVQQQNYEGYMGGILKAYTGDGQMQLPPAQQVIEDQKAGRLNAAGAGNILAYIEGAKGNQEGKTDPRSYKEAVTRLTDPDDPLTRDEFLKNVKSGAWKFDAKTYGQFLTNIGSRGGKLEKAMDTAYRSRLAFWKTQFGGDTRNEQFMNAVGQAQTAKDAGELGATPDEVYKNLDAIFKPNADLYAKENFLGRGGAPQQPKPGIIGRAWNWAAGGGQAGAVGPETVTKDGKKYRVIIRGGRKMVDPTPLPQR